jgi:hypothetical protein
MVLNDPERIGGSQPTNIAHLFICKEILGASECGIQQTGIAKALCAAMLFQAFVMEQFECRT